MSAVGVESLFVCLLVCLLKLQLYMDTAADGPLLPFNEYVAKNVGIRRASGSYFLVSNPEIILPSALWSQFANHPRSFFLSDLLVSSDRRDSWTDVEQPLFTSVNKLEEQLAAGVRVVWSHLQENGDTLPRGSDRGRAPGAYFAAVKHALARCPRQDADILMARKWEHACCDVHWRAWLRSIITAHAWGMGEAECSLQDDKHFKTRNTIFLFQPPCTAVSFNRG